MTRSKKALVAILACGFISSTIIGSTFAYFTDEEANVNTFTVGKVQIDLTEPKWEEAERKPMVPNDVLLKDPTVTNTGDSNAYVFLEVSIPKIAVRLANVDGTRGDEETIELFDWGKFDDTTDTFTKATKTVGNTIGLNEGWVLIHSPLRGGRIAITDNLSNVYIFAYKNPIEPSESTLPLFDAVKFVNVIEGQLDGETLEIPIKAYAIQSDFIDESNFNDSQSELERLQAIYNVYTNQNPVVGESTLD